MMTVRLAVDRPLAKSIKLILEGDPHHYLTRVMRLTVGDDVRLFNGKDGEWQARIEKTEKKSLIAICEALLRAQTAEPGPNLYFVPIRKQRMAWLIEKAVELGVASLHPVTTQHGQFKPERPDRIERQIVEACEQSERLTIPKWHEPLTIGELLDGRQSGDPLLVGLARHDAPNLPALLAELDGSRTETDFLVGPEGGFSADEVDALVRHPNVRPVKLAPLVLRSETAALTFLAQWQAYGRRPAQSVGEC